jgi:hypothetical protein
MASIERTAYPRFKQKLTDKELEELYQHSEAELEFVYRHARGDSQQLTLLALLKCHQHLGYLISLENIPQQVTAYRCKQLKVPKDTPVIYEAERSRYRYYRLIRSYLQVKSYSQGGKLVAEKAIKKAAHTMSDPADLINVAMEKLIEQRYELPSFTTLDRLVGHIRQSVHEQIYTHITALLTKGQRQVLDALLVVQDSDRLTDFSRLKQIPGKPTLKQMYQWITRLNWLNALMDTTPLLENIAHTKVRQFAAQAAMMETQDMQDVRDAPKRYTLLICLIHHMRVETKDQLVRMFLKRTNRTHNRANEKLKAFQEQHRELEE